MNVSVYTCDEKEGAGLQGDGASDKVRLAYAQRGSVGVSSRVKRFASAEDGGEESWQTGCVSVGVDCGGKFFEHGGRPR